MPAGATAPRGQAVATVLAHMREVLTDRGGVRVYLAMAALTVGGWLLISYYPVYAEKRFGLRVLSLVHEMPRLIEEFGIEASARAIAEKSDVVVFPATLVSSAFETTHMCAFERARINCRLGGGSFCYVVGTDYQQKRAPNGNRVCRVIFPPRLPSSSGTRAITPTFNSRHTGNSSSSGLWSKML